MIERIRDFYPIYLQQHQHVWNRRLHILGQVWTLGWLVVSIWLTLAISWRFLPLIALTPIVIYPVVWPAHRFIEKNRPATWSTPAWITKACDWLMLWDILRGRVKI